MSKSDRMQQMVTYMFIKAHGLFREQMVIYIVDTHENLPFWYMQEKTDSVLLQ